MSFGKRNSPTRLIRHDSFDIPRLQQRSPPDRATLGMRDEDSRPYLVEQSSVGIGIDFEIRGTDVRCHLAEILIERILVTAELYPFEIIRPHTETKTVEPHLLIENGRQGNRLRPPSGIASPGLIDKIGGESPTQKDILKSFAPVRRRLPGFGKLAYSVGKNEGIFPCVGRLLVKHVCMVTMISMSERIGHHRAANGKTALFGNLQD